MMMNKYKIASLVVLGTILSRLFPHIPNLTPALAGALFLGSTFRRQWVAYPLALAGMVIPDLAMGMYATWPFVYTPILLIVLLGHKVVRRTSSVVLGSLGASLLFYIISNFGVWLQNGMYPMNLSGLLVCYTAGLPFLYRSLFGTLIYSGILFGLLAPRTMAIPTPHNKPC